jgi:hypothetical protein
MAYAGTMAGDRRRHGRKFGHRRVMLLGLLVLILAGAPVAYMLWPQPKLLSPDAPSIPISVGAMAFNVPPAAIRFRVQRRPGAQARVDLAFLWPSLDPPDPSVKPRLADEPDAIDRLFVTIATADRIHSPLDRMTLIYPRYTDGAQVVGPDGLSRQRFRDDTPYRGEDLIHHPAVPERFLLRCARQTGPTPPMCLHDRRIGGADVTVRFPREWLDDWRAVADGIDRLIASFRPVPQ